jgi:hypothetical protein
MYPCIYLRICYTPPSRRCDRVDDAFSPEGAEKAAEDETDRHLSDRMVPGHDP